LSPLKYPLFVSDIDGTLVTEDKKIPVANKESISAYRDQGGRFTLATGRSYPEAKPFIEEMDIRLPVILCNGGVLYDPASGHLEATATIEREILNRTLRELNQRTDLLDLFVYTLDRVFTTRLSPFSQALLQSGDFPLELIPRFEALPEGPWIKLVAVAEPETMPQLHAWADTVDDPLEFVQSSENYFEILPPRVSKGNALSKLARRYGFAPEQCAAIGDHLNDLSMVKTAGQSAAVANAHPQLIQAARQIVPSNEEAGVAHFVRQSLLATAPHAQGQ